MIGRVLVALLARVAQVVWIGGATSVVCGTTAKVRRISSRIRWVTPMVRWSTPVVAGSVSRVGWGPCSITSPGARVGEEKLPRMSWSQTWQGLDLTRVLGGGIRLCLCLWIRLSPQPLLSLLSSLSHFCLSPCIGCGGCNRCHKEEEQAGAF